jgi:putative ABC transport system substrate-binding protein
MAIEIGRRQFISSLGSAAVTWPLAVRAQQPEQIRRISVLTNQAESDPRAQAELSAFAQTLQQLGWTDGRNVRIDYRWTSGDPNRARSNVAEAVALAPDVILSQGASTYPLLEKSRSVPIVFVLVVDPVGAGLVDSLAHPGGNVTGFMQFEYGLSGKWLELLKEIAPSTTQVTVIRDPALTSGTGQFGAIQAVAPSLGIELKPVNVGDAKEIERAITSVGRASHGGLIVTASPLAMIHLDLIVTLAATYKLPAVYPERYYVTGGGLISYGPDFVDEYRRAAGYIDRILKGEKPADLPVQAPTKYDLVVNLKTAKALGLTIPPTVLSRADEVIE